MKCPKCGHEAVAGDIFCSRCGTKLENVCPKCGNKCREGDLFCSKCGTKLDVGAVPLHPPVDEAIPKLEDMHAQLQSLIPDALARKYLTAEQEAAGENRLITALFADISGFTPLSANQSSEAMFQLVQDCFKQLVSIVANYEGSISGFRGDGLLALFGAPILHENDAERAILAALDMRSNMQDRQLEVSIGINTAMMTVGEIQTQLHREYTAYGTDINLAKRLQEAAEPGQILVGAGTYRLTRRAFDFQILPSLDLKGLPQPVTACVVQQAKPHPEKLRGILGLRARMIGREREFAELKEAADAWLGGQGQIVSIIGEAGIGKSRLVSELKTYLAQIPPNPPLQRGEKRDHLQKEGKRDYPAGDLSNEAGDQHPPLERGVRGDFPADDLTDEIRDQPRCLEGRCVSIGQPISYWPFLDILRAYFGLSEEDDAATRARKVTEATTHLFPQSAEEVLPFLGRLFSISFGNELDDRLKFAAPEQIRHQTLMRLRDFFVRVGQASLPVEPAKKRPLLLILEDLHWADDLSLDLLSLLMDALPTTPFMLLCVYRPERQHRVWQLSSQAQRKCLDRYTEITLNPLSSRESRQLVETLLTIEYLPESVKDMILQKSEGNPFFIEEVIRSLIEQDLVYRVGDHWKARAQVADIHVPDTIQSVLLSRVDRLQAEAKYVLQYASVIGRLFKYRLLEHLTQQERDLDRYLSEFEERELVYEERTVPELEYAFKHALTQEATYQGILERHRREFHHQVAVGIERLYRERLEEYYEELAHHYSMSEEAEKAVEYLLKAGEKAKGSYANEVAISHFQTVLEMIEQHGVERNDWKLEALRGLGEVHLGIGKSVEAEKAFEEAIELAKEMELPPRQLMRLYHWISEALFWQSRFDEVIRYGEMGLEILGDDTECPEAALMNARIAVGNGNKGNSEKWREYTHRNMAFIKKLPYSVELRPPYVHIVEVVAYRDRDLEAAWQWSKELETVARENHDLRALAEVWYYQGGILRSKGDHKSALSSYQEALEMHERIGDDKHASWCHGHIARILLSSGDIEEAEARGRVSLTMTEQVGNLRDIAHAHELSGDIVMCQHRWEEAISHYQKYLEGRQAIGNPSWIAQAHFRLGRAYLKKGDHRRAVQCFEEVADESVENQGRLSNALGAMEEAYMALERCRGAASVPAQFVNFCRSFKERHADAVKKLPFRQWYLEPAEPSGEFSHLAFTDDFDTDTIHPSQAGMPVSPWNWIDEFGDCAVAQHSMLAGNQDRISGYSPSHGLEIRAANSRDLNGLNVSAPRLMREISGDFAVEVCVSPASNDELAARSTEKPQMGGLLVWKDRDNFLRFEKGAHGQREIRLHGYVDGKHEVAGRGLLSEGKDGVEQPRGHRDKEKRDTGKRDRETGGISLSPRPFVPPSQIVPPCFSSEVHLRLERAGEQFSAYCSVDGEDWLTCGKLALPLDDPIQIGVHAIGMIDRTIYCGSFKEGTATLFRRFQVWTRGK